MRGWFQGAWFVVVDGFLGAGWSMSRGGGLVVMWESSMHRGGKTILSRMTNSLIGEYHETKNNTQG